MNILYQVIATIMAVGLALPFFAMPFMGWLDKRGIDIFYFVFAGPIVMFSGGGIFSLFLWVIGSIWDIKYLIP